MFGYEPYQVEDFVLDPRFRRWVLAPTPPEDAAWEAWLRQHPGKRQTVEQARQIVLALRADGPGELSEGQATRDIAAILARADENDEETTVRLPGTAEAPRRMWAGYWAAAAASVVLILGMFWWYGPNGAGQPPAPVAQRPAAAALAERINTSDRPLLVNLPDQSTVILQPRGRVRYAQPFTGGKREVFLEGEAFFEVTKNPHQPFLVYAGKLVTKVLGTSFHVAANPRDAHVTVRVKTGRVSLFTDTTAAPALVLAPNEQAVYWTADARVVPSEAGAIGEAPAVPVPDTDFAFRDTPVTAALARMEKAYSIPITYDADALKGCNITASFTDEPFAVKLDLICRTIGVTYRIEADRAVITGKGCGQ
ncbi:MAG: FecR domain-containing protein [Cytophagales bacterium]|nr:FecR domain-containing protein [Cytophagales bacterium]